MFQIPVMDAGARAGWSAARRRCAAVRRRSAACVAVVMVSVGVVACSGDGGAAATASASGAKASAAASASASSTPSASPTPSALPSLSPELQASRDEALAEPKPGPYEGMDEFTAEGAKLSAVYFMDLYRYAFITGDIADFETMSEDDCIFCNSVISNVTYVHESGGWTTPWEETVVIVASGGVTDDPSIARVDLHFDSGPTTTYAGDGTVIVDRPESIEQSLALELHWDGQVWRIGEGESL